MYIVILYCLGSNNKNKALYMFNTASIILFFLFFWYIFNPWLVAFTDDELKKYEISTVLILLCGVTILYTDIYSGKGIERESYSVTHKYPYYIHPCGHMLNVYYAYHLLAL